MGVVYRAFDETLLRPLAIKHLLSRANPTASLRFRREAQAAAKLNHPAIVHIYEIIQTPEGDWIVMELVEGETLERRVREGKVSLPEGYRLCREVAEGLAEAHAHGILHRDLKTSNVMVTASGRAKILDFGLAKFLDDVNDVAISQTGIILGTCYAMSPEQVQGFELDARSDLFSLGTLIYEVLTRVSPFRAATASETLARVCGFRQTPPCQLRPEVPRDLSDLVDRLLSKDIQGRPRTAEEVVRFLKRIESRYPEVEPEEPLSTFTALSEETTLVDGVRPPSLPSTMPATPPPLSPRSERRQITLVCCDLSEGQGHSGSSSRLAVDPELLHELMPQLRLLANQVAGRHGGHVESILGRRVLMCFGYPQVHEDPARRAVRAALELVREVEDGFHKMDASFRSLRAGIHTGPAVVAVDQSGAEPMTLGATLDEAAEVLSLAQPGQVVVSATTWPLIKKGILAEALEGPSRAYRVLDVPESSEPSGVHLLPLMGRENELEILASRWAMARDGAGQVVLISGEAGIGKSRLVLALRERLGADSDNWLSCHGSPYIQNSPLQPWLHLLRQQIMTGGDSALESLERLLRDNSLLDRLPLFAALLELPLGSLPYVPALSPDQQREQTLEALVALVLALAERQPLIFMIEDLHWLDPSTLSWLDRLIGQVSSVPLLLLVTVRLQAMDSLWGPQSHITYVTLGPLGSAAAEMLVDRIANERSLPPHVRQQIVSRTDGVPLFLEEMTKAVIETQGDGGSVELPATLRDSLTARLDRLGSAKSVAQRASVIGRVFPFDLLAAISVEGAADLQKELRRLIQAELLHRRGTGAKATYLFKHALVRDAAYESLLKRERQQFHRAIAEALERSSDTAETQPEVLAHHYTEAGLAGPAIDHWYRAGMLASRRSASQEAMHHFNSALQLLESLPEDAERDRRELRIQNALAAAVVAGRGFLDPAVERAYARTEVLALRLEETAERFWAVVGLHMYHVALGSLEKALDLAERLLAIAQADGSPTLLSIAWFWLGTCHFYQADFAKAHEELERACDIVPPDDDTYRQRNGVDLRVLSLSFNALSLWHLGHFDQARGRGEQAVALARELGHPFSLCFGLGLGGAVLTNYLRDAEGVLRNGQEAHALASEHNFPLWIWQSLFLIAWARWYAPTDNPPQVDLGPYQDTQTIAKLAGGAKDYFFCLHAEILMLQGRFLDAVRVIEEAMPLVRANGMPTWRGELCRLQGEALQALAGRPEATGVEERAEELFREALDLARRRGSRGLELRAALSLGRLWRHQRKETEACNLVADTLDTFREGFGCSDLREARAFLEAR